MKKYKTKKEALESLNMEECADSNKTNKYHNVIYKDEPIYADEFSDDELIELVNDHHEIQSDLNKK